MHSIKSRTLNILQTFDYSILLPLLAHLPISTGYYLSNLRGKLKGYLGADWRSMALGSRHVARLSFDGYKILFPDASDSQIRTLVRERFQAEGLEEFEGNLIIADRISSLKCTMYPQDFLDQYVRREKGLVLLTPHFESFWLGTLFLARSGIKINAMTSSVTDDPRVSKSVQKYFYRKYRGMERAMNGGRMLNLESGLRQFYQILERGECLVVLADAPAVRGSARSCPLFMGCRRNMSGGAERLARKTSSDLGAFVCTYQGSSNYTLTGGPIVNLQTDGALDSIYNFLSTQIIKDPGRWGAVDLLPLMTVVDNEGP